MTHLRVQVKTVRCFCRSSDIIMILFCFVNKTYRWLPTNLMHCFYLLLHIFLIVFNIGSHGYRHLSRVSPCLCVLEKRFQLKELGEKKSSVLKSCILPFDLVVFEFSNICSDNYNTVEAKAFDNLFE